MQNPAFQPTPPPPPGSFGTKGTGVQKALAFARAITVPAVVLAGCVFFLQAVLPEGAKPSTQIGNLHGKTESAEMDAKRPAQVQTTREVTTAQAVAPLTAQSYETQYRLAEAADSLCILGQAVKATFGLPAKDAWGPMIQACGEGDRIRANIARSMAALNGR